MAAKIYVRFPSARRSLNDADLISQSGFYRTLLTCITPERIVDLLWYGIGG